VCAITTGACAQRAHTWTLHAPRTDEVGVNEKVKAGKERQRKQGEQRKMEQQKSRETRMLRAPG